MISLKSILAPTRQNNLDDLFKVKSALGNFGYLPAEDAEKYPYPRHDDFNAIRMFQKDNKLDVDGVMKPDGPTVTAMNDKLESASDYINDKYESAVDYAKGLGGFLDFGKNYLNMRIAETIDADKYFHCKANYEATRRGNFSESLAKDLSNIRESIGQKIKGDPKEDMIADQAANKLGRTRAKSNDYESARDACADLRPNGLHKKY
jgi:hypothetical protein